MTGPRNRSVWFIYSDYIIKEKTVLLQKKDSEGFGFVLRGAKAQTPIEEFTPTPAFPALQYLESVDEGGVAWRAGLRMGDFLIEVNGQNVVKVGHRQVVNMIRQGGNSLMVKVVMVTRNPEMEEASRKKMPQQSKRLTPPAISMRSKSMTSELEEMAASPWKKKAEFESSQVSEKKRTVYQMALNKLDEILAAAQQTISTTEGQGSRLHGGKRDRTRGLFTSETTYDQSGMGMMSSGTGFGYDRPQFVSGHIPQHGMILRQKSIGVTEEEKQYLHPPAMKFSRSLSVPGPDDIPPPPTTAPPEPPLSAGPHSGWRGKQSQQPPGSAPHISPQSAHYQLYQQAGHFSHTGRDRGGAGGGTDHPHPFHSQQSRAASRKGAGYMGDTSGAAGGGGRAAGLRRGYSNAVTPSAAAAMSQEQMSASQQQLSRLDRSNTGAVGVGGVLKGGGRRGKGPLVKQSKVEDGTRQSHALAKALPEKSSIPIPTIIVKAPSTSSSGRSSQGSSVEAEPTADTDSKPPPGAPAAPGGDYQPKSVPGDFYGSGKQPATTFIHPLTGKVLDPSSPLGLALAARERALKDDGRIRRESHFGRQLSSVAAFPSTASVAPAPLRTHISPTSATSPSQSSSSSYLVTSSSLAATTSTTVHKGVEQERAGPQGSWYCPPPAPSVDADDEFVFADPLPPPLQFANSFDRGLGGMPGPSPNSASDTGSVPVTVSHATTTATTALTTTTATTSLSELAVITITSGGGRRADHPPTPTKSGESQETVVDSGIEELDSRSSSDHHLDNILGIGGTRGDRIVSGEGERASDLLDTYMTCLDGQTFEMHNAKSASSTYPKLQRYRDSGSAVSELRRHTSTAPASFRSQKRRDEEAMEAEAERAGRDEGDETGVGPDSYSETQNLDRPSSIYFERPHTPELKPHMKASIISELSTKLQQMGNKSMEGWGGQRSISRHRFSEDSSTSALSPPTARSPSPLPTSPCQPHQPALSPTPSLSSQSPLYPSWTRSPSPQPSIAPSQPQQAHPPLSPSYSPYPTSPKHRASYRSKALEFQFIPSRESRRSDSHHLQRRRAPSPLISPSERPKLAPPRPSSLPILPSAPLYSSPYELRGSITPPSPGNPLGDPYFTHSPPLFAPSGAPPPNSLVGSRSLSPTHFLSGTSSPPLHPLPPPACLSYPHLSSPPSSKPFASKPLPYWTKYDVADWLGYLNLGEHRERFLDNEIDGTHLPSLTKEDYLDLGVTRVGHRMNIERALKRLLDRLSSPFPVSALSPREGQTERRRDEGTRS
ncbi:hypothetical protein COCON_G00030700 [Conger conger]|uniref:SH3 and multiple ankyrin repeat domains 1 n=1 Tax=Conger conger TaxID=82655 RepID=A0A9Q1I741_CONCO|nr:hypothetical protein COCON_G00030700 [Conger conger]